MAFPHLLCVVQVSGYVLIVGLHVSYVPLTNLRIIRGQSLYTMQGSPRGYSLYVGLNYQKNAPGVGLKELQLTSLHGIDANNRRVSTKIFGILIVSLYVECDYQ